MKPLIVIGAALFAALAAAAPHASSPAVVSGLVFVDANQNEKRDPGEAGIPGVAVSDQDTVVLTDKDGLFSMPAGRGHGYVFVSVPDKYAVNWTFYRKASEFVTFPLVSTPRAGSFTLVHASDAHVSAQSAERLARFRDVMDSIQARVVLITGDLVKDALRVGEKEATVYYDLFNAQADSFRTANVRTVPGNHEIFGIERDKSGVSPDHPLFGKAMYRSYRGPDYYSFTMGGVHFVALNTVDVHDGWYYGHVDSLQLKWLERDLAATPPNTPVVTFNHIPFFSTSEILHGYTEDPPAPTIIDVNGKKVFRHTVSNAAEVLAILSTRRHILALGGHIHMRELIDYGRDGPRTRFENGAALVGPTKVAGSTFPSGFTVYTVGNGTVSAGRFVKLDPIPRRKKPAPEPEP